VLTAMTQAAMLHSQGSRVDPARVSKALQVGAATGHGPNRQLRPANVG
jgi:arginine/lysine/ornithine decarboxylase